MADVKKKNTVTVEKQDGTKKEVETKNVSTSKKSGATDTKSKVVDTVKKVASSLTKTPVQAVADTLSNSNIKDRLASAYSKNKPSVYSRSGEYSNGYTDDTVGIKAGDRSVEHSVWNNPYYSNIDDYTYRNANGGISVGKATDNSGRNSYSVDTWKNGDYDGTGYNKTYDTALGTFQENMDGDGVKTYDYTSPIRKNSGTLDDGRTYSTYTYDNPNTKGGHYDDFYDAYAQRFGNTYAAGVETPYNMKWIGEREVDTPVGTFGVSGGTDSPYGVDAYYKTPVTTGREIYPSEEGYTDYARYGNNEVGRYVDDSRGTTGHYLDVNGRNLGETYRADWTGIGDNGQLEDNSAYGIAVNTPLSGNYYNEINLPMGGMIGYGNDNGRLSADYTPANGSLQDRLLRALTRRRQ